MDFFTSPYSAAYLRPCPRHIIGLFKVAAHLKANTPPPAPDPMYGFAFENDDDFKKAFTKRVARWTKSAELKETRCFLLTDFVKDVRRL